jgi:hypothetical protein
MGPSVKLRIRFNPVLQSGLHFEIPVFIQALKKRFAFFLKIGSFIIVVYFRFLLQLVEAFCLLGCGIHAQRRPRLLFCLKTPSLPTPFQETDFHSLSNVCHFVMLSFKCCGLLALYPLLKQKLPSASTDSVYLFSATCRLSICSSRRHHAAITWDTPNVSSAKCTCVR